MNEHLTLVLLGEHQLHSPTPPGGKSLTSNDVFVLFFDDLIFEHLLLLPNKEEIRRPNKNKPVIHLIFFRKITEPTGGGIYLDESSVISINS